MSSEVKFLTIEQVAEMLQVTKMTIYNLQKKGLPFIKLGKNVRFDQNDVIEWVNSNKVKAVEQDK
ncbi:helix-turn-helix domain-containing protein [Anoxybacterium hadale]|uniref:Helix-turn-helix domain-containing protein n=1 Tax=Anoxybacterium hadale TaxID=3408580 RepID=A0ACD1ADY6_9FIRM|nr:helix-turn-helix domain-containing protein [Clostridiales bacterium]